MSLNNFHKALFAMAGVMAISSSANAAVPLSFTHQGLLKEDGNLVNGEREITAIIVDENDAEVARSSGKVPVDSGRYTMTISNIDSDKVAAAQKLKLWVQVEGDLLTPALTINSVPYALVANRAESVNTSGSNGTALYRYFKSGAQIAETELSGQDIERCPCDTEDNNWNCPDDFNDEIYNVPGCYDKYGPAYQYYQQGEFVRPLDVVAIENNTIGIGTAQPDAPLHILSDAGESDNGYAVHIADPNPKILLEDLDGKSVTLQADNGMLNVNGGINAQSIGGDLLNRIYPVGSIYISVSLATEEAVHNAIGGKWQKLQSGLVLWSSDDDAGNTIEAGLPNIKGATKWSYNAPYADLEDSDSAFYHGEISPVKMYGSTNGSGGNQLLFDASRSSPIYGNSDTVQPPAIKVYMFKRIE